MLNYIRPHLVAEAELFLSVFKRVHETGAAAPQSLHLSGVLLEHLAGPHQSFQLVLDANSSMRSHYIHKCCILKVSASFTNN